MAEAEAAAETGQIRAQAAAQAAQCTELEVTAEASAATQEGVTQEGVTASTSTVAA